MLTLGNDDSCAEITPPSDEEIIRAVLAGDVRRYGLLVARYQDRLFRSMVQVLGSTELAEDVVQESFLRAFTKLPSFGGRSQFYTWLYRIAINTSLTQMRRKSFTRSLDDEEFEWLADSRELPDQAAQLGEQRARVRIAIEQLEANHRTILILREFDGLDYESIADVLGLNVGTVRSRLARARARLRTLLAEVADSR